MKGLNPTGHFGVRNPSRYFLNLQKYATKIITADGCTISDPKEILSEQKIGLGPGDIPKTSEEGRTRLERGYSVIELREALGKLNKMSRL